MSDTSSKDIENTIVDLVRQIVRSTKYKFSDPNDKGILLDQLVVSATQAIESLVIDRVMEELERLYRVAHRGNFYEEEIHDRTAALRAQKAKLGNDVQ